MKSVLLLGAAALATIVSGLTATAAGATIIGSATRATQRGCTAVSATTACDGGGPGQRIVLDLFGGGIGVGGLTRLVDGTNRAWSDISFDAALDLPVIKAYSVATGNVRMNINTFAFQSFAWNGAPGTFSITGDIHIVDSSTDGLDGVLPGGAIYTQYVGIWDPSILAGLTTPQDLFTQNFYASCGAAGVLGMQIGAGSLAGGDFNAAVTTSECTPGALTLQTGQEVLVVAGLQLPVNRGAFADSSATFVTRLGDDLSQVQREAATVSLVSAISQGAVVAGVPEPASWAMLLGGFGLAGAAMRRRRALAA